jgi:uncharacterized protein (DUF2235 family)
MSKNIVFCADGTWQDPNDNSNVIQLYNALGKVDGTQWTGYDSGVGTDGDPLQNVLGGAFGAGLFTKIKQGYSAIAAQYQPGDKIFLFGFSRGAYTVRSLAGMIAICGLPTVDQSDPKCVDMAFEAYRNAGQRQTLLDTLNESYKMDDAKIELLGVWDTVGSLGIPAIFGGTDPGMYGFLSVGLHPDVLNAVQALSIDEERMQFQPALWTPPYTDGQSVTQVWFAGVHCDVGGGYPADADGSLLSNIPLRWMASYAASHGLLFNPGALAALALPAPAGEALATLHKSRTLLFDFTQAHIRSIDDAASIANSVGARLAQPGLDYAPSNLHCAGGALAAGYTVVGV